jgi:ABC-type nitrate/sulfonate/bicarbonate transport system substrate-binding protein
MQDFLRATMKGLADALADPDAATQTAIDLVEANGNPSFLSLEGESFRWTTDAGLLQEQTPNGDYGVPDVAALQAELDAYASVGLFAGAPPTAADFLLVDPIAGVYDESSEVIWPSS